MIYFTKITSIIILFCLSLQTNKLLAQNIDDFRTIGNATFASATGWQRYDGSAWVAASSAPTSANGIITVSANSAATVTSNVTLDQIVVAGFLQVNAGFTLTLNNGAGDEITLTGSGQIYNRGTINNCSGTLSPANAFTSTAWASPKGTYNENTSTEPTLEASLIYFNQASTTAHIYWTNGNGRRRIVVLKPTSAIDVNALTDNTVYTADANFAGAGSTVDGTGKVVFNGVGNQVNVTGLTNGVTYHVAVFEYNDDVVCGGTNYNYKTGSPLTTNFTTGERPFITTWQTTTANETITIPVPTGLTYTCNVDWGDGTNTNYNGTSPTMSRTYATAGTYTITIGPNTLTNTFVFPRIFFGNGGQRTKIRSIAQWGSTVWTSMESAFAGCSNLGYSATDAPNLSNVTSLQAMFEYTDVFNGDIGNWNTSNITNMGQMFRTFTSPSLFDKNIGNWDTSNVTNMSFMFDGCDVFNGDISKWNTSNVTNMMNMLQLSPLFNQDISKWNTSSVTNMIAMFNGNTNFNQPIDTWNVNNITLMSQMFQSATAFNQNIGNWNTSNVTNMNSMFQSATAFNQNIGAWNTSAVTSMSAMFFNAAAFNQNIGNWNTSNVTNMSSMFQSATAFNQNIGNWILNTNVNLGSMLNNSGMSAANYEATLLGWAGQAVSGRTLGASGRRYCDATNRNILTSTKSWTISGDASFCTLYRTNGNVTFSSATNWEGSSNNITWITAASAPTSTQGTITIRNGHTATITANISLDELVVESGGTLQINTTRILTLVNGTGTDLAIQNGALLNIQGTGSIVGAGSFELQAGGTFRTANVNGFNAIGVSGTETFQAGANYEFNGTSSQTINNPVGISANNFTINNSTGVTLSNDITVTGTLTLTTGAFNVTSRTLTFSGATPMTSTSGTLSTGANYVFNGTSTQTINNPVGISANNITIDNNAGVNLSQNISISGVLTMQNGKLNLAGKNIDLGTTGSIVEDLVNNKIITDNTASNDSNQGGAIIATNRPVTTTINNIAGLGYELQRTNGADYNVNISRFHYRGASSGIKKTYQVTGNATGTNTTIKINYATDELTGINIANLRVFRWSNTIAPLGWTEVKDPEYAGVVVSSGANFVQVTNINAFSHWTLGDSNNPLPVSLFSFKGQSVGKNLAKLTWVTASEQNNKGFEIEKSQNASNFQKIGFVEGSGNSITFKSYTFRDENALGGNYYRLKQIDFDGKYSYSQIIFVENPLEFFVYPNPSTEKFILECKDFNHTSYFELIDIQNKSTIKGNINAERTEISVKDLPKGMYILNIWHNQKKTTQKVIIH